MTVSPVQSSAARTNASAATTNISKSMGDANAFLQLLVTELKNQDPMKPLDPTQTVTQLATFSSVEQSVKTNALLSTLNANAALSQAGGVIGRTVASADGAVSGVVQSITLSDNVLVANLANGQQTALSAGATIS